MPTKLKTVGEARLTHPGADERHDHRNHRVCNRRRFRAIRRRVRRSLARSLTTQSPVKSAPKACNGYDCSLWLWGAQHRESQRLQVARRRTERLKSLHSIETSESEGAAQ